MIQRSRSIGITVAIASEVSGNIPRAPVWYSSGSSASTRNWLNVKPVGPISGTNVLRR